MKHPKLRVAITGLGVVTSCSSNTASFSAQLKESRSSISKLETPLIEGADYAALLEQWNWKSCCESLPLTETMRGVLNTLLSRTSLAIQASVCSALEAFLSSKKESKEIGLIVAGNNFNQKRVFDAQCKFAKTPDYLTPTYAMEYHDTYLAGIISEILDLSGPGLSVGGASASGLVGLIQGVDMIRSGRADSCLVVGALTELSSIEVKGYEILGALNTSHGLPGVPFDARHAGFVYGQGSGSVLLERYERAVARGAPLFGEVVGTALALDANHSVNPSVPGEVKVMQNALEEAEIAPEKIDYINAHGTGAKLGDETELEAIDQVFKEHKPLVNSTKGLIGHCLTAAGMVESIATLIQMQEGFVHSNRGLEQPIREDVQLVKAREEKKINYALKNSFGFGGINSAVVFKNGED